MLRRTLSGVLLLTIGAALLGCPASEQNAASPTTAEQRSNTQLDSGMQQQDTAKDLTDGAAKLGEEAKQSATQMGEEVKETTEQAMETVKEGYGNFTQEVKDKYPQVVESMQAQLDSMNEWAVDKYRDTFSSDAPERDKLVDAFKAEAEFKPKYSIDNFAVESSTETEAVAVVSVTYTGTDVARPLAQQSKKYRYTFHKQADSSKWKVYKVEQL